MIGSLLVLAGVTLSSTASAAECKGTYTSDQLLADMGTLNSALRVEANDAVIQAGTRMADGLPCMKEPVPGPIFASVYRSIGVARFLESKPDEAKKWFNTARELEPGFQWDINDVPPGTPLYDFWGATQSTYSAEVMLPEGMRLATPPTGEYRLDGKTLTEPGATPGRYHLVQEVSGSLAVEQAWLIDSGRLPGAILVEGKVVAPEPTEVVVEAEKKKDKRKRGGGEELAGGYTADEVKAIERERPKAKVPLIMAGAAGVLAGGGLYAASFVTRESFEGASTEEELAQFRTLTNTLVLSAGGITLVGLGVGYYGIVLDGGAGVGITVRF